VLRGTIVWIAVLTTAAWPEAGPAQDSLAAAAERQRQLIETIEQEQRDNGPYSEDLIDPLTSLRDHYEEFGDYELADAITDNILQIIRANHGLRSLEQADTLRELMSRQLELGFVDQAWEIEQELLFLASRNLEDFRAARIVSDVADRRIEILQRYDTGEIPREISLGCYYDESMAYMEAWLRGSRPINSAPSPSQTGPNCDSGDRSRARRALLSEALRFYSYAANLYRSNAEFPRDELKEVLTKIRDNSFRYGMPAFGRSSLESLIEYEIENPTSWLNRIEAMVQLADWEIIYTRDFGTKLTESAQASYQESWELANQHGVPEDAIRSIFSPGIPVMIPSVLSSPLVSPESNDARAYIDVSFIVTAAGKAAEVEILGSTANVTRSEQRSLIQLIKRSRFRPLIIDGQLADSEPMIVRYVVAD